jgi:hypothetical protein
MVNNLLCLTYLQHEANQALLKFAEKGNSNTVVIPSGMSVTPLINTGK